MFLDRFLEINIIEKFFKLSGHSEEKRKKERNGIYKGLIDWSENRKDRKRRVNRKENGGLMIISILPPLLPSMFNINSLSFYIFVTLTFGMIFYNQLKFFF